MRRVLVGPILSLLMVASLFGFSAAVATADPRDFTLINGSGITITHIYVTASDDDDWGDDIMGQDVLNPGESVNIIFDRRFDGPGCLWDIHVLGRDGSEGYLYKIDLCTTKTVTFS